MNILQLSSPLKVAYKSLNVTMHSTYDSLESCNRRATVTGMAHMGDVMTSEMKYGHMLPRCVLLQVLDWVALLEPGVPPYTV